MKTLEIDKRATELCDAAHEFQLATDGEWSSQTTTAALARMEDALLALAASGYEIRGKAAKAAAGRNQRRTVALDEMAAEFARSARKCRDARLVIEATEHPGRQETRAAPRLVAL